MKEPAVLAELIRASMGLTKEWRRVRFALTPVEHDQLRLYFLKKEGKWHNRIRGVPLVIEEYPPDFVTEFVLPWRAKDKGLI